MVIIRLVLLFFAFNVYYDTYGQKDCNLSPLVGEWKIVNAYWGVYTNVDSLKLLSLSHKSDNFLTIEFNNDSTYMFRLAKTKKQRKGYYISDEKKCELILNKNRKRLKNLKYSDQSNWEIIYIDNEILIYKEDNNPKNYATHVLLKK